MENKKKFILIYVLFVLTLLFIFLSNIILVDNLKYELSRDIKYYNGAHNIINYELNNRTLIVHDIDYCNSVTGLSMNPTMYQGNVVCFESYTNQKLMYGQIVEIKNETHNFVHRIIGVYDDYVVTKGDNNIKTDGKINKKDIKGISKIGVYK
jgi:signal peptidase I